VKIIRTDHDARHPWPEDTFLQGGSCGVVLAESGNYRTAFVEAFPKAPATFIRGEGATVPEAEDAAWARWQAIAACPAHPGHGPFEPRGYTNGAGYCTRCGSWFPRVLPPQPDPPDRQPSRLELAVTEPAAALEVLLAMAETLDDDTEPNGDDHA
jgi:hypothetical protein